MPIPTTSIWFLSPKTAFKWPLRSEADPARGTYAARIQRFRHSGKAAPLPPVITYSQEELLEQYSAKRNWKLDLAPGWIERAPIEIGTFKDNSFKPARELCGSLRPEDPALFPRAYE